MKLILLMKENVYFIFIEKYEELWLAEQTIQKQGY